MFISLFTMEESTSLKRDIIETRKAIQDKCNLLKRRREEMDKYYNMKYRPISGPLNEFLLKATPSCLPIPLPLTPPKLTEETNQFLLKATPARPSCLPIPEAPLSLKQELTPPKLTDETIETPSTPLEMISQEASTPHGQEIIKENLDEIGEIASKYIVKFIRNETEDLDDVYGIRYDGSNFTIGDTIVKSRRAE
jgi:hypothetical protein